MSHELCHIQFKMEQRGTSTSYAVHRRSNSDVPLGGHRSLTLPAQHSAATGRNVTSESHNLIPTGSLGQTSDHQFFFYLQIEFISL